MNLTRLSLLLAAFLLAVTPQEAHAVTIDWVTVGDPGNTADDTTYGAVADAFQIIKYEFTNQQYKTFLNSVAATDTYSLYNADMGSNARGGITQSGASGSYTYAVKSNMGDKPVNYVSWFDAARVSNWLMNGGTSSSSTETGAYTLISGQTSGNAPAVNSGATFYVPTEDQWYKAAYYKGGSTNAGYWDYATQSDLAPTAVTAGSTGIGSSGSTGNFANYNNAADWNSQDGNVTTVGTNGGASAYSAFDMSGNVYEWNDLTGAAGSSRGLRGGNWGGFASDLSFSGRFSSGPSLEVSFVGFRLARSVGTIITVASGTQTQTSAGYPSLSGTGPVFKAGAGTLVLDQANPLTGSLTVQGGRLQLANGGALASSTLAPVAGGTVTLSPALQTAVGGLAANAGGLVDVGTGLITVAAGLSRDDMLLALGTGRGDGSWNGGSGITSSTAAASGGNRTVGWLDNGDGSVTFGFAAPGDTNLDWSVDILDAANFLAGGRFDTGLPASWIEGDFNYDGVVDILDAADFLTTGLFNAGEYNASGSAAGLVAPVPEPVSPAVACAIALAWAAWCRRVPRQA